MEGGRGFEPPPPLLLYRKGGGCMLSIFKSLFSLIPPLVTTPFRQAGYIEYIHICTVHTDGFKFEMGRKCKFPFCQNSCETFTNEWIFTFYYILNVKKLYLAKILSSPTLMQIHVCKPQTHIHTFCYIYRRFSSWGCRSFLKSGVNESVRPLFLKERRERINHGRSLKKDRMRKERRHERFALGHKKGEKLPKTYEFLSESLVFCERFARITSESLTLLCFKERREWF